MKATEIVPYIWEHKTIIRKTNSYFEYENGKSPRDYINLGSVISFIVKQAGKWCGSYACDAVTASEWIRNSVNSVANYAVENGNYKKTMLLGFYDCGVDGTLSVEDKLADPVTYGDIGKCYNALYVIDIEATAGKIYKTSVELTARIYGYEADRDPREEIIEEGLKVAEEFFEAVKNGGVTVDLERKINDLSWDYRRVTGK